LAPYIKFVFELLRILKHNYSIRAFGNRVSRPDLLCSSGAYSIIARELEDFGLELRCAESFFRSNSISVNRRPVESWNVHFGHNIRDQNTVQRRIQWNVNHSELLKLDGCKKLPQRIVD
jgi:hypothetical protein